LIAGLSLLLGLAMLLMGVWSSRVGVGRGFENSKFGLDMQRWDTRLMRPGTPPDLVVARWMGVLGTVAMLVGGVGMILFALYDFAR